LPLDLSGDLAAARRDAREQWLAQREQQQSALRPIPAAERNAEHPAPRLILPDDNLAQ